jgi:bifunctional non-homologous end joining protein LigD
MSDKLAPYKAKRDFTKTPEPTGGTPSPTGDSFVIQKHAARRLHYDFRLELDGVLKSWAVTRGPSLVPGEKRLAVETEDHPLEYGGFEGVIPPGEYGGGTVQLWDRGRWFPEGDPRAGYKKGHLNFRLEGAKLHGSWHLVRMRRRAREKHDQWLLIKSDDDAARPPDAPDILEEEARSVTTGRTVEEIAAAPDRVWTRDGEADISRLEQAGRRLASSRAKPRPPRRKPAPAGGDALPAFVPPMLASSRAEAPTGADWLHEIKFDGYRLQARLEDGRVALLTRRGLDWTQRFAGLARLLADLPAATALLDGEVVVEGGGGLPDFAALQDALSNGRADAMIYYAFDLLHLDGRDLTPLPLVERKQALKDLLSGLASSRIRYTDHIEGDGPAMVRHACRLGLEGVVAKRSASPYRSGRSEAWLKVKCSERQEFIVVGYQPASGNPKAVGSLQVALRRGDGPEGGLVFAGGVGTGYTQQAAALLFRQLAPLRRDTSAVAPQPGLKLPKVQWVEPRLVVEVEFRGWTGDGQLRHAAFKGIREDKEAEDVTEGLDNETRPEPEPTPARRAVRAGGAEVTVAGVKLTHPDRVLWHDQGVTKLALAEFYADIADRILPHLVDRPLSLVRCPDGQGGQCFYQKHAWRGLHPSIRRVPIRESGKTEEYLAIDDLTGLVSLVQMGVLELHPWGSRAGDLERPDRLTFDLDPGEDVRWDRVIEAARLIRGHLQGLGLESFVKTTGGKGLHVVVPLTPDADWDTAKAFTHQVALELEQAHPDRFVTTMSKKARPGRIFLDYLRNGRGATAVAAYSTRARPGAPVATPLAWDELGPSIPADRFTVSNLGRRLAHLGADPWQGFFETRQGLPAAPAKPAARRRRSG